MVCSEVEEMAETRRCFQKPNISLELLGRGLLLPQPRWHSPGILVCLWHLAAGRAFLVSSFKETPMQGT